MIINRRQRVVSHRKALAAGTKFQQPEDCPFARCSAISMYEEELKKHKRSSSLRGLNLRYQALPESRSDSSSVS